MARNTNRIPLHPQESFTPDTVAKAEGGLWALGGYFYQFLGSLCLAIKTFQCLESDNQHNGYQVLFSLEEFDQDAVEQVYVRQPNPDRISPEEMTLKERRFIQYKHSRRPEKYPISPAELLEIVTALLQSRNQANRIASAPSQYLVISNRPCSPDTLDAIAAAQQWTDPKKGGTPHKILDAVEEGEEGKDGSKSTPVEKNVKKSSGQNSIAQADKGAVRGKEPKRLWSSHAINLLRQIEWKQENMEAQEHAITQHAYSLGVLPREIEDRIQALIGKYFQRVSSSIRLVKSRDLDACLSGLKMGRPFTNSEARQAMKESFDTFCVEVGSQQSSVARGLEQTLLHAIQRHALIFLHGDGGNGKTTLLERLVSHSVAVTGPSDTIGAAFGAACCANQWDHFWLSQKVAEWRGDTQNKHSTEQWGLTLERLAVAAESSLQDCRTVLHLALDAVDELDECPSHTFVEALINEFWHKERALEDGLYPKEVLIVTSRSHPETFVAPNDPFLRCDDTFKRVCFQVPQFSTVELAAVAQASAGRLERSSLESATLLSGWATIVKRRTSSDRIGDSIPSDVDSLVNQSIVTAQEAFADSSVGYAEGLWDEAIVESLLHPSLWRCFEDLPASTQIEVLRAQPKALQALSEGFVRWFLRKARVRRRRNRAEVAQDGGTVLQQAAQCVHSQGLTSGEYLAHWLKPAESMGIRTDLARYLYQEALSAGLIEEVAKNRWCWKHLFLEKALIEQVPREEFSLKKAQSDR